MNEPRFFVFTDPRPLDFPLLETWHPPAHQEGLVRQLLQNGFHPLVNGLSQPTPESVQIMYGIVVLEEGYIMRCDQYKSGKILCIQWYNEPVSKTDLDLIKDYCGPFYGIGNAKSYITADEHRLIEQGYMMTPTPLQQIRGPTFLGNHVRVTPDEVTVLE